jgi:hypothetical protein
VTTVASPSTTERLAKTASGETLVIESKEGLRLKDLPPAQLPGNFERCPDCHAALDLRIRNQAALTADFKHGFHLEQGAACADCHEQPTHSLTGTRRPPMGKCFDSCHSQEEVGQASGECAACHPADFSLEPSSHAEVEWLPVAEKIDDIQGKHSRDHTPEDLGECSLCHAPSFCRGCHQVDMPHPSDWQEKHQESAREVGGSACVRCHPDRSSCAECHHDYDTGGKPWVEVHFLAADEQGVGKCIGCHSTKTCAHCHTTGEYLEY